MENTIKTANFLCKVARWDVATLARVFAAEPESALTNNQGGAE